MTENKAPPTPSDPPPASLKTARVWRVQCWESHEVRHPTEDRCIQLGESAELPEQLAEYLLRRGDFSKSEPAPCLHCSTLMGAEMKCCAFCGRARAAESPATTERDFSPSTTSPAATDEGEEG